MNQENKGKSSPPNKSKKIDFTLAFFGSVVTFFPGYTKIKQVLTIKEIVLNVERFFPCL